MKTLKAFPTFWDLGTVSVLNTLKYAFLHAVSSLGWSVGIYKIKPLIQFYKFKSKYILLYFEILCRNIYVMYDMCIHTHVISSFGLKWT